MIGKNEIGKYGLGQVLVGIGVVFGLKRGEFLYAETAYNSWCCGTTEYYERDNFFTLSIPFEFDFILIPFKVLGLGFSFVGEVNVKTILLGFSLKLALGNLRYE